MRFHVVSVPYTNTDASSFLCPFTSKLINFCKILNNILDHDVFLYSGEINTTPCTEHVPCISEAQRVDNPGQNASQYQYSLLMKSWEIFNSNAIRQIKNRFIDGDIICYVGGMGNKPISDQFPNAINLEFGIGHSMSFAKYRIFESYFWMHATYVKEMGIDHHPPVTDDVIYGYCDIQDLNVKKDGSDYFLYVGRMTYQKGVYTASEVCKESRNKIIFAGAGDDIPEYGEFIGAVDHQRRNELMANAKAVFVPTMYMEPFGTVIAESMSCGTPVITTDWGSFPELVENGKTGFRCRTKNDFIEATKNVESLDREEIQKVAVDRFSLESASLAYKKYFQKLGY